jgi:hypothetical protein
MHFVLSSFLWCSVNVTLIYLLDQQTLWQTHHLNLPCNLILSIQLVFFLSHACHFINMASNWFKYQHADE